ncbi:MAG: peptidase M16 [Pyrinomonas sp.]
MNLPVFPRPCYDDLLYRQSRWLTGSTHREMLEQVRKTCLPNGVTVLTERMPGLRSATIGVWIRRGSRHEPAELNGICHFIEHAVFKGTERRTALDIAIESDRLGGHLDAYTTHELTGFSMKVVDAAIGQALDLLADIVARPRFDPDDLAVEQRVILEEIKMVEDTPEELLAELFNAAFFPNHSLGRPIEGTPATVSSFDRERTIAFHQQGYATHNIVVAAAGNVEHEALVELVDRAFAAHSMATPPVAYEKAPTIAAPIIIERKRDLEQAHMILAAPWPAATSDERFAASLLVSILGGGTSSRLWQAIREERGLAYSVGAAASAFSDVGMFQIYAGTSPDQLDEVLDLSLIELRRIVREPVGEDELRLVKDQAISSILLALESSSMRAGTLARQEILHGRRIPPEETIARIEAVTAEELQALAQRAFRTEALGFGALGNLNGFRVDRARLEI